MTVPPDLCQTWSETQIVGFLMHRLKFNVIRSSDSYIMIISGVLKFIIIVCGKCVFREMVFCFIFCCFLFGSVNAHLGSEIYTMFTPFDYNDNIDIKPQGRVRMTPRVSFIFKIITILSFCPFLKVFSFDKTIFCICDPS